MATAWLSSSARGLDDGSSYANAWGSIADWVTWANASGTKGDTLNIVNDGNHVMPTSAGQLTRAHTGTDYDTDPGIIIRGTDTSGNPEMATLISNGTGFGFLYLRANVRYLTVEGLKFDHTLAPDAAGTKVFRYRDSTSGPIRTRNCHFLGWADNDVDMNGAVRYIWTYSTSIPADWGEVSYCLIQNMGVPFQLGIASPEFWRVHHCVFWNVGEFLDTVKSSILIRALANSGHVHEFYNNTWYIETPDVALDIFGSAVASGDYGAVEFHSNVFWINSNTLGGTHVTTVFGDGSASTATWAGTVDYNIFYGGPDTDDATNWAAHYGPPWVQSGGGGPEANDVAAYETADTVLFNAPSTPFAWTGTGDGWTITAPGDLRLLLHTTAGKAGVLPGAMPSATTDYQLSSTIDSEVPDTGDTIQIVLTAANSASGSPSSALEIAAAIPAGLTYSSHVAAQGTYVSATGVWTVGALGTGSSTTLTLNLVVDADQGGQVIVWTGTVTSGTPDPGAPTADDTTSETMTVVDDTTVIDPENPAAAPFIDTLPLIAPDLSLEMLVKLEMIQSRQREVYEREDFEDKHWGEFTSKRLVVSTNTTVELNLGGIGRGEYMIFDSTAAVDVSAVKGGTQRYWTNVKTLVIARGDFERVHIRNTSVTVSATILVGVVD